MNPTVSVAATQPDATCAMMLAPTYLMLQCQISPSVGRESGTPPNMPEGIDKDVRARRVNKQW